MSDLSQGRDGSRQGYSQRPHHQISRSITEVSFPSRYRHHHLHAHHHRHHDRHDGSPQAAALTLEMPRSSLEFPRSEGATPFLSSAEQSRRTSVLPPGSEDIAKLASAAAASSKQKERQNTVSRIAGLKKSLLDLHTFSTATTQRVDETYYSVLEKLSSLQSTLVAIKELARMSQEEGDIFKSDSQGLVAEIDSQLDTFSQFDERQSRIESLQERIVVGRQKVSRLSERLDVVRERVEGWEKADLAWQEKTRRRLRVIWIITLLVIILLVLIFVGVQYASDSHVSRVTDLAASIGSRSSLTGKLVLNDSKTSLPLSEEVRAAMSRRKGSGVLDEGALHALDEL